MTGITQEELQRRQNKRHRHVHKKRRAKQLAREEARKLLMDKPPPHVTFAPNTPVVSPPASTAPSPAKRPFPVCVWACVRVCLRSHICACCFGWVSLLLCVCIYVTVCVCAFARVDLLYPPPLLPTSSLGSGPSRPLSHPLHQQHRMGQRHLTLLGPPLPAHQLPNGFWGHCSREAAACRLPSPPPPPHCRDRTVAAGLTS